MVVVGHCQLPSCMTCHVGGEESPRGNGSRVMGYWFKDGRILKCLFNGLIVETWTVDA